MQLWQEIIQWSLAAHALLIGGALLMLALTANMLRQHRSPAASAAWLLFMLAVPYLGVPLYLLFGTRKVAALHASKAPLFSGQPRIVPAGGDPAQRYLQQIGLPPAVGVDRVDFHADAGVAFDVLRTALRSAQRTIDVCMFILADDGVGREIIDILSERARAGVRVRLLLDGVGSFLLPRRRLRPLLQAGGRVAWFVPVLHRPLRGRTNLRNHRKLVIADQRQVWSGGRNLAFEYLGDESTTAWYDLSFDISGDAVTVFGELFDADWSFATGEVLAVPPTRLPADAGAACIQAVPSGPDVAQDSLHDLLVTLIVGARQRVILVSPYFVPDEVLQTLLRLAARRGVRVDLVVPRRSNHRLADIARARFVRQLDEAGANIWLLPDAMLHAKAIVIDDRYALAGSANLDLRSLFLNFELMTLFHGAAEVAQLTTWIDALRGRCETWCPRPVGAVKETLEGLVLLAAFQL